MLQFKNVSLVENKRQILRGVSFEISPGETVAFLGRSGAGKSTIFKLLTLEKRPSLGHISLNGFLLDELDYASVQEFRRNVGVIFQDFRLIEKKTVYENIAYALEVCGEPDENIPQKVEDLLTLVGLQSRKNAFPKLLSGGEQQRICIARALIHKPQIVIADEPTGNLDPVTSQEVIALLKELQKQQKFTFLFSTHDREFLKSFSPRVVRLENGTVALNSDEYTLDEAFGVK